MDKYAAIYEEAYDYFLAYVRLDEIERAHEFALAVMMAETSKKGAGEWVRLSL